MKLSTNALTSLKEVGLTKEEIAFDLGRVSRGETTRDELLALCLNGAETPDRVAAWTEYVDAVIAAAASEEDTEKLFSSLDVSSEKLYGKARFGKINGRKVRS